MSQQIHVLGRLTVGGVLLSLAPVVEHYGKHAALQLHAVIVWHGRIYALKHVEHLIGVVEQSAGKGMVHRRGGRILQVKVKEACLLLLYDRHEGLIAAHAAEAVYASLPLLTAYRVRHELVEFRAFLRVSHHLHVHEVGGLLALIVAQLTHE